MHWTVRSTLLLCTASLGCGAGQPTASLVHPLPTDRQPAGGQECSLLATPTVLPGAADILDRSTLPHISAGTRARPAMTPRYAAFAVFFDSSGTRVRVRTLDSTLDEATTDAVGSSFAATVPRDVSKSSTRWGVLVKAAATDSGWSIVVDRMEYCPCALLNRVIITRTLEELVRSRQIPGLIGTRQIVLEVKSDTTGAIVEKRLSRTSGSAQISLFTSWRTEWKLRPRC